MPTIEGRKRLLFCQHFPFRSCSHLADHLGKVGKLHFISFFLKKGNSIKIYSTYFV